jgi:hypothetical protein
VLEDQPIVSFCIPTCGREEILKKTLESFFIDNADVKLSLYEICISDNSPTYETKNMLEQYFKGKNIVYKRNNVVGFLNSVEALKLGTSAFLKLHNNYTIFLKGMLSKFILNIKTYVILKPCIFFTFGNIKSNQDIITINNFNDFLYKLSYWSTWSTAFGIWKEDFEKLYMNIEINSMFPHTSLLFKSNYKSNFIIDNCFYFDNQILEKKGGYHITKTFCVDFIEMLRVILIENIINKKTYKYIKNKLLCDFFSKWYVNIIIYKEKYTFDISNTYILLQKYYRKAEIIYFYLLVGIYYLRTTLKKHILYLLGKR